MEKKDFDEKLSEITSVFLSIKDKIGASNVDFKIVPRELKDPIEKFNAGKPITGVELQRISENWQSKDPLIDEEGNAFVLYIPDFSRSHFSYRKAFSPEDLPKYHVSWCSTLSDMQGKGRMKRYIKKTDLEKNLFKGKKENDVDIEIVLYACKNCRTTMTSLYGNDLYYRIEDMDILKFFSMYGKQNLHDPKTNRPYSVVYPKHWREISRRYREEANWECDVCHKSFENEKYMLDVHHINGVRSDVSKTNLRVLCKEHHADQPGHAHYKKILKLS